MSTNRVIIMSRFGRFVIIGLSVFFSFNSIKGQEEKYTEFSVKVAVYVNGEENIKGKVNSYIKRELRSLNDVYVVENEGDWELEIVVIEIKTISGYKRGVAISITISEPYENYNLVNYVESTMGDTSSAFTRIVDASTSNLCEIQKHWLITGSNDDLKDICQGIVADFDSEILEERRMRHNELLRLLKDLEPDEKE